MEHLRKMEESDALPYRFKAAIQEREDERSGKNLLRRLIGLIGFGMGAHSSGGSFPQPIPVPLQTQVTAGGAATARGTVSSGWLAGAIYAHTITEEEANDLVEQALELAATQDFSALGFDIQTEWTAIALHGISYTTAARWRYEGWPNKCIICGEMIDINDDSWRAFTTRMIHNRLEKDVIAHWDCSEDLEEATDAH
ncbi:unnamed protein product [Sphagnum balticum]